MDSKDSGVKCSGKSEIREPEKNAETLINLCHCGDSCGCSTRDTLPGLQVSLLLGSQEMLLDSQEIIMGTDLSDETIMYGLDSEDTLSADSDLDIDCDALLNASFCAESDMSSIYDSDDLEGFFIDQEMSEVEYENLFTELAELIGYEEGSDFIDLDVTLDVVDWSDLLDSDNESAHESSNSPPKKKMKIDHIKPDLYTQ